MTMKRTDLEKHLAKKLDGQMKAGSPAERFGPGAKAAQAAQAARAAKAAAEQKASAAAGPKLVAVSARLPADLLNQLRERAAGVEGGMSAVLAQAAEQWLAATPASAGAATAPAAA